MKHAGSDALDRLQPLLAQIRQRAALREKSRGTFYRGSRAFLHFHEHGDEFFADVRLAEDFERLPATRALEHQELLARIDAALADGSGPQPR